MTAPLSTYPLSLPGARSFHLLAGDMASAVRAAGGRWGNADAEDGRWFATWVDGDGVQHTVRGTTQHDLWTAFRRRTGDASPPTKPGRPARAESAARHKVTVRLTDLERSHLDRARGSQSLAQWLRDSGLLRAQREAR